VDGHELIIAGLPDWRIGGLVDWWIGRSTNQPINQLAN
jgi:hypothetical protein